MVDTDDTRRTTDDGRRTTDDGRRTTPWVWHKLPTGELKIYNYNQFHSFHLVASYYQKYTFPIYTCIHTTYGSD